MTVNAPNSVCVVGGVSDGIGDMRFGTQMGEMRAPRGRRSRMLCGQDAKSYRSESSNEERLWRFHF
jgi:hypothetical protein